MYLWFLHAGPSLVQQRTNLQHENTLKTYFVRKASWNDNYDSDLFFAAIITVSRIFSRWKVVRKTEEPVNLPKLIHAKITIICRSLFSPRQCRFLFENGNCLVKALCCLKSEIMLIFPTTTLCSLHTQEFAVRLIMKPIASFRGNQYLQVQTVWIQVRCRVTRHLTWIQTVWHSGWLFVCRYWL